MLSIIIPTYNEREVILKTISEIERTIKSKHEIIVVDDDSKDRTWEVVRNAKLKNVKSIRKTTPKSLSSSVVKGFETAKYENLLVLDADGQHDPAIIENMLKYIENHDFVIGSRFVLGGSVENWSKKRILISRIAAMLSIPLTRFSVKDPMTGFFMTKKSVFNEVKDDLSKKGYKIFLEMYLSLRMKRTNTKIKEIPYRFRPREIGKSKLSSKVIIEYVELLIKFSLIKYGHFLKFLVVGISGVIINTSLLFLLTEKIGLFYIISGIIATEVAIINNFLLNNYWSWNGRRKKQTLIRRFLFFNGVSRIGLLIVIFFLWFLTELGIYYIYSNLIGIGVATIWSFFANDKITFK